MALRHCLGSQQLDWIGARCNPCGCDMSRARYAAGVAIVAMGMAGLYFKVEYSGWIVAVGLLMVL